MKLVLGTEVGLGQGDFVLDGDCTPGREPRSVAACCYYYY